MNGFEEIWKYSTNGNKLRLKIMIDVWLGMNGLLQLSSGGGSAVSYSSCNI